MASVANFPGKLGAVLLCGGLSTRMGQNKALLSWEGEELWRRQLRGLADATGVQPFLSLRAGFSWHDEGVAPAVWDDGSSGPLGGISAALERLAGHSDTHYTHLAVLAVDLPFITTEWWTRLAAKCTFTAGAVGRHVDGRGWEPLATIYPIGVGAPMLNAKCEGRLSLQQLIESAVAGGLLAEEAIRAEDEALFRNWNTPEDVTRAKA